jgi:large repetitive protein
VEPSIPAELAVMVENHGYGPAVNMMISSAQPVITENESGLAINFSLIGSNLQGQPAQLGVLNIPFGTIPPQSARIGQWWFTSSLLGKFVSYEAEVVHANSFGNPELSLVQGVELA